LVSKGFDSAAIGEPLRGLSKLDCILWMMQVCKAIKLVFQLLQRSLSSRFLPNIRQSVNRPKGIKKRSIETLVNAAKVRLFTAKTGFQRRRDYACLDIDLPIDPILTKKLANGTPPVVAFSGLDLLPFYRCALAL
jgi:hypothetical protein